MTNTSLTSYKHNFLKLAQVSDLCLSSITVCDVGLIQTAPVPALQDGKNDINTNRGVAPTTICENISHTDDKVFVYNLYEHDWFVSSDNWSAGGIVNTSTGAWKQKMYMRCEHSNEYYMFDPNANHQRNLNTRVANPVCYLVSTNGHTYHSGKGNNEAKLSRY